MKTIKTIIVIAILSILSFNLKAQDTIVSQSAKHEFSLPVFTGIDAGETVTVYISQGDVQSVKADDFGMDLNVKDGILKISPNKTAEDPTSIRVYVVSPKINYIKASGIAKVKTLTMINTDELEIKASGASTLNINVNASKSVTANLSGAVNLTLKGLATNLNAKLSGATDLKAGKLITKNGVINVSGVSKANVNISNKIEINKSGMAKVTNEKKAETETINDKTTGVFIEKDIMDVDSILSSCKDSSKVIVKVIRKNVEIEDNDEEDNENGPKESDVLNLDENNLSMSINPKKAKFKGHWAGFDIGFNGYVDKNFSNKIPSNYEFLTLNMNKSIVVNLNFFKVNANLINNRVGIVSGIGLQYNNYRFANDVVLLPDSGRIYGVHTGKTDSYIKSKLTVSWIRVPLFLEYQTSKANHKHQFHISAGTVFGYRIGSHSKQKYVKDGDFQKDKIYNDFYLNPIKLDAEVRIGWGPINVFASYAATTLFQDGKGPELYPYTVGISLIGW